jgi:hypothetical protein
VTDEIQRLRQAPALSIRQPWAELILRGDKNVEVRTWTDRYRGPIWLHTGAKIDQMAAERFHLDILFMGGLVGIAELTEVRPFTRDLFEAWRDRHRDFSPFPSGRDLYGWIFSRVKRLVPPLKCKGALGLFEIDTSSISDEELVRLRADR